MRCNPSHRIYNARWKQTTRAIAREALDARLFVGVYPCALVYADKGRKVAGDYARLATLIYATLALEFAPDCPAYWRPIIEADAKRVQARRGENFSVSASGQFVRLGG